MDIERREHSSESLVLLQQQTDVALQSLYVIQGVLLEKHSKYNIAKQTGIFWIFYQVLILRKTKNLGQVGRLEIKISYCTHRYNTALFSEFFQGDVRTLLPLFPHLFLQVVWLSFSKFKLLQFLVNALGKNCLFGIYWIHW